MLPAWYGCHMSLFSPSPTPHHHHFPSPSWGALEAGGRNGEPQGLSRRYQPGPGIQPYAMAMATRREFWEVDFETDQSFPGGAIGATILFSRCPEAICLTFLWKCTWTGFSSTVTALSQKTGFDLESVPNTSCLEMLRTNRGLMAKSNLTEEWRWPRSTR